MKKRKLALTVALLLAVVIGGCARISRTDKMIGRMIAGLRTAVTPQMVARMRLEDRRAAVRTGLRVIRSSLQSQGLELSPQQLERCRRALIGIYLSDKRNE